MGPNLTHECVLELPKLSCNVNECKPLNAGIDLVSFSGILFGIYKVLP